MNKFGKYTLIALALNILSFITVFAVTSLTSDDGFAGLIFTFFFAIVSLLIQLIVGLVYTLGNIKTELGKAMLLSIGIILLIGFSICSQG